MNPLSDQPVGFMKQESSAHNLCIWPAQRRNASRSRFQRVSTLPKWVAASPGQVCAGRTLSWILTFVVPVLTATGGFGQSTSFGSQAVGSTSLAQSVTITAQSAGTVNAVEVLTLGVSGLDFEPGAGAKTCGSATLSAGATCSESVTFTPAYPGLRTGAVVLLDSGNNVLGTAYVSGVGVGGLDVLSPSNVIEIAGIFKEAGSPENGIPATGAMLRQPASVALDGAGNLYIADSANNEVRMVCAGASSATISGSSCSGAGIITTIAGTGAGTYTGDNGSASASTLNSPSGISFDGAGNLYIADTGNNVVRKITASTGTITTVAGDGTLGFGGDGLAANAVSVELNAPWGVTVDAGGNLYIADTYNQRIRRVDAATGIITTSVGNGDSSGLGDGKGTFSGDLGPAISAGLSLPYAVAFDSYGDMLIPDAGNNRIRAVKATGGVVSSSSIISTLAGNGAASASCANGPTNAMPLNSPEGVAVDPAGNLYISDTGDSCIRKANVTSGDLVTIAQTGNNAISVSGVPGQAEVYEPIGIVLDGLGNVYYADYYFMLIDEIQSNKAVLNYVQTPVRQGSKSATQIQILENDGNASSNLTDMAPDANAAVNAGATTCSPIPYVFAEDADCNVGAIFAPSSAGNPLLGNIDISNDSVNSQLDIELIGDATQVNSTTTTLVSSLNPSAFGQNVTFTATVTTGAGTGNLTGNVTFMDGAKTLGAPVVVNQSTGQASYQTPALTVGAHEITASYGGDSTHFDSTSATLVQTVLEGTTTLLVSSANPAAIGQSITLTATVTASAGGGVIPDGTVTFTDGSTILTNATLSAGVATFTTSTLANGLHSITATYDGDSANQIAGSVSNLLKEDVLEPTHARVSSTPNPSEYGNAVTFTATVTTSGTVVPTGAVNILDGGKQIGTATLAGSTGVGTLTTSSLAVGSHTITAAYLGDTSNGPGTSAAITQMVNRAQTTTSVAAAPSPGIAGAPVAITATVKTTQGVAAISETVTFTDSFNGATVTLGSAALGTAGTAAINPILAVGSHSIAATFVGSFDDSASTSAPLALTVLLATTSTVVSSAPNPSIVESEVTFTASVTGNGGIPTGSVTFLANGNSIGSAALNAKGIATLSYSALPAGSYSITANYAGDTNDLGSSAPAISQVVGTIPTVTALGDSTTTGPPAAVILLATVAGVSGPTPTGTVTFTIGTTTLGSASLNSDGVATLEPNLSLGTSSIVANYGGDALHSPSTSQAVSVFGTPTSFSITVNPASVTMATTQNTTVTVNLASIDSYSDTIGLGCGSLPAGVTCHFSSPSVSLGANGTQTAQLIIDTNNPLGGGASAMNARSGNRGAIMAGLFLPLSAIFGCIFFRLRKRHWTSFSAMLLLLFSGAAMLVTGCGNFSQSSAAPGTYVIQVNGTGVNSNLSHYQSVTLNITQ